MRAAKRRSEFLGCLALVAILALAVIWPSACDNTKKIISKGKINKTVQSCYTFIPFIIFKITLPEDCRTYTVPVADPAPPVLSLPDYAVAARQADCSLTRLILDSTFSIQPVFTIPNYQSFLHQLVRSTTSGNQFKNGCKDATTGIASQRALGLGPFPDGSWGIATISDDGLNVQLVTPSGQIGSLVDYPAFSSAPSATP